MSHTAKKGEQAVQTPTDCKLGSVKKGKWD